MFDVEEFRKLLNRRPFVPLRILTTSGAKYDIMDPELVMIGPKQITLGAGTSSAFDQYCTLVCVPFDEILGVDELGPKRS